MDKETLSNYGWIVICVLVLAVMIALAGPFGRFISNAIRSTTHGLFDVNQGALDAADIEIDEPKFYNPDLNPNDGTSPVDGATYVSNDTYYDDYTYTYSEASGGWSVAITDKTKTQYDDILESINGQPITSLEGTFAGCTNLVVAPKIPDTVTNMKTTFKECSSLGAAPEIPSGLTQARYMFQKCTSLTTAPDLSSCTELTDIQGAFKGCTSLKTYAGSTDSDGDFSKWILPANLTTLNQCFDGCASMVIAPAVPDKVTTMRDTFKNCASLTTAPVIPSGVEYFSSTFCGCTSLTGTITVNSTKAITYGACFYGVDMTNITFTGSAPKSVLNQIGATGNNWTPIE